MAYTYTGTVFAAPLSQRLRQPSALNQFWAAVAAGKARRARRDIMARAQLIAETRSVLGDLPATTLHTDGALPFAR
jgi:hypothetical protein